MIEYDFIKENNILYIKDDQEVDLKKMLHAINVLAKDDSLPKSLKILEDATNVNITFTQKDLPILIEHIEKNLVSYKSIHHAVVHTVPASTAMAMLIDNKLKLSNYHIKVFSTLEAAKNWLEQIK